jgi:hypothetical protein
LIIDIPFSDGAVDVNTANRGPIRNAKVKPHFRFGNGGGLHADALLHGLGAAWIETQTANEQSQTQQKRERARQLWP